MTDLLRTLGSGHPPDELGLTKVDGLWDLRGYRLPRTPVRPITEVHGQRVTRGGAVILEGLRLEDLDLSGAHLAGLFLLRSTVSRCRFDQADVQQSVWKRVAVTDTSFARADLREAVIGDGVDHSRFERVVFRSARMANAGPSATFVDCDFSNALLTRVAFRDARLIRCRFAGSLLETTFYGKRTLLGHDERLEDVDFSDAQFRFVGFRRLDMTSVRLPTGDGHVVVRRVRCTLARAIEALRLEPGDDAKAWRGLLEDAVKRLGPRQQIGIFGRGDFEYGIAGPVDRVVEILRLAEAACRNEVAG